MASQGMAPWGAVRAGPCSQGPSQPLPGIRAAPAPGNGVFPWGWGRADNNPGVGPRVGVWVSTSGAHGQAQAGLHHSGVRVSAEGQAQKSGLQSSSRGTRWPLATACVSPLNKGCPHTSHSPGIRGAGREAAVAMTGPRPGQNSH